MSAERLLSKVRAQEAGLLLDTNVLLLHLIERTERDAFRSWKRTDRAFNETHVDLLELAVDRARRLVTTPHVLAEVTNLSDSLPRRLRDAYWDVLTAFAKEAVERGPRANVIADDEEFRTLGTADIGLAVLSPNARPLVLTVDADLTASLERRRLPVANLHHFAFATST